MKKAISILIVAGMLSSMAVSAQTQVLPERALGQPEIIGAEQSENTDNGSENEKDTLESNKEEENKEANLRDLSDGDELDQTTEENEDKSEEKSEENKVEQKEENIIQPDKETEETDKETGVVKNTDKSENNEISLFAAAQAAAQSFSTLPEDLCGTEETGIYVDFDGSFDKDDGGWKRIYRGAASRSTAYDHTGNGGGSLKVEAKTYNLGYGEFDFGVTKNISTAELERGKTYKVTAWIYGDRIKQSTDTFNSSQDNAAAAYAEVISDNRPFPSNTLGNSFKTPLVEGEWVKVETYFVAQGKTKSLNIRFPYYYDDKKFPESYDIYYVDDITIEEQTNANVLHYTPNYTWYNNGKDKAVANKHSFNRLDRNLVIKNKFADLDLSYTKSVLKKGESTELKLFKQDGKVDTLAKDVIRTECDLKFVTAETENKDVAVYEDGKIVAKNYGNTIITIKYNDGDINAVKKLMVKVIADDADAVGLSGICEYAQITDPLDKENLVYVGTVINYINGGAETAKTTIPANKRVIVSYRSYFPGGGNDMSRMGQVTMYAGNKNWLVSGGGGVTCYVQGTGMGQTRPSFGAGWITVDYIFTPNGDGTSKVEIFVNGESANSAGSVAIESTDMIAAQVCEGVIVDDFVIAVQEISFELKNEAELENIGTVSTDEKIEIEFSNPVAADTIERNLELRDKVSKKTIPFKYDVSENIITVYPEYPYTNNTEYEVVLKKDLRAETQGNVTGNALGADKVYSFRTQKNVISYSNVSMSGNRISFDVTNNNSEKTDVYAVISIFDENTKSIETVKKQISLNPNETVSEFVETVKTADLSKCTYELYFWDNVDGKEIKSLSNPYNNAAARNGLTDVTEGVGFTTDYYANEDVVKIKGKINAKRAGLPVTVRIYDQAAEITFDNVIRVEEILTGEDGNIAYSFKVPESSEAKRYTVYINTPFDTVIEKEFMYASVNMINAALKKIDNATIGNVEAVFTNSSGSYSVRDILNLNDKEFDSLKNRNFLFNCLLNGKPYEGKAPDIFRNVFRQALKISTLLEGDTAKCVEEIKNNHSNEYWNISKDKESGTYKTFINDFSEAQQAAVIAKILKYSTGFNKNDGVFNAAVVTESILGGDYSTVCTILDKFTDIVKIDYTDYNKLNDSNRASARKSFYDSVNTLSSTDSMETKFKEISAELLKKQNEDKGGKGSGSGSGSGSGGNSGSGGAYLPGIIDTTKPAPEWYVDESKATEDSSVFKDLQNAQWAVRYVNKLYSMGAVTGKADGEFAPSDNMTREELCKVIVLAFNLTENDKELPNFADVSAGAWYEKFINICAQNGVINGIGDNLFGVGRTITREETATILVRAADAAGITLDYDITAFPFDDADSISDWAKSSVSILRECLIVGGISAEGEVFAPKDNVTRAQAAKMIVGVIEFKY